jgi:hypothetical protein
MHTPKRFVLLRASNGTAAGCCPPPAPLITATLPASCPATAPKDAQLKDLIMVIFFALLEIWELERALLRKAPV